MIDFARELRNYRGIIKVGYSHVTEWVDFWTSLYDIPIEIFHLRTLAQSYWNQL